MWGRALIGRSSLILGAIPSPAQSLINGSSGFNSSSISFLTSSSQCIRTISSVGSMLHLSLLRRNHETERTSVRYIHPVQSSKYSFTSNSRRELPSVASSQTFINSRGSCLLKCGMHNSNTRHFASSPPCHAIFQTVNCRCPRLSGSRGDSKGVVLPSGVFSSVRHVSKDKGGFNSIHGRISSLQMKKRSQRKKKLIQEDADSGVEGMEGFTRAARHSFLTFDPNFTLPEMQVHRPPPHEWQVTAYATADEYQLEKLMAALSQQGLYSASPITADGGTDDVLHAVASYRLEMEDREIYFFREGSVVFWNVGELERTNVLRFLEPYQEGPYQQSAVTEECESLTYKYNETPSRTKLVRDKIMLNPDGHTNLEKYTFSDALAMSVKLGLWEASLDTYIDNIEYVSEELSKTGRVVLDQNAVLQRLGQLCALRHLINLSSDLLDTPDFYWNHEQLEQLYKQTSDYLSINKRTSVMNVKLNHCVELMELLKSHLNEEHSSRLEWIIIILIMVEVAFEMLHFAERFF